MQRSGAGQFHLVAFALAVWRVTVLSSAVFLLLTVPCESGIAHYSGVITGLCDSVSGRAGTNEYLNIQ